MLHLLNEQTGEKIPITMPKKQIKARVAGMSDEDKAFYYAQINFARRLTASFEKEIKTYIKSQEHEFDDNMKAEWKGIRISKRVRQVFDPEKFKKEGSDEEKSLLALYEKLESQVNEIRGKYTIAKSTLVV